ncbi:flagellar hook-basal body complex protein [Pontibaca methylaminivorans]|uniref:Flagellar basal-body rod protein FlgF n=1 Tax=Pontibaca methylaminivorans TaxID=515897 RepID=A0A1R3WRG1_9RHOB|nr:flagellar hook-basal body complex protein [Pontibaca methylaminivorans]SIT80527.1 flagellar basal-body rod protein FlgF [Pontibaca methylaminivorans]
MDAAAYVTLSRQSGLMQEMRVIANNIANSATTGFRQEGVIFSEYVRAIPDQPSLSMTRSQVRNTSQEQGMLTQTNGRFDLAIQGDGYFLIETPAGERLTRAGSFTPNAQGDLVTADGHFLLDAGGAPVFVPPDAGDIGISSDGTISSDGRALGQIGLFQPVDPLTMQREDGVMFRAGSGVEPAGGAAILQGYLESSNVSAILQVSRMIEVQRAYEAGQNLLNAEDERLRNVIKTLVR